MSEVILKVEGMSCGHCVSVVEKAAQSVGAKASVDLASKKVSVQYDGKEIDLKSIINAIEEQGYDIIK